MISCWAYQDFLGTADSPCEIPHVSVCLYYFWGEFDPEPSFGRRAGLCLVFSIIKSKGTRERMCSHLMNRKDHSLGHFPLSLYELSKWIQCISWCNIRISVKAISHKL